MGKWIKRGWTNLHITIATFGCTFTVVRGLRHRLFGNGKCEYGVKICFEMVNTKQQNIFSWWLFSCNMFTAFCLQPFYLKYSSTPLGSIFIFRWFLNPIETWMLPSNLILLNFYFIWHIRLLNIWNDLDLRALVK